MRKLSGIFTVMLITGLSVCADDRDFGAEVDAIANSMIGKDTPGCSVGVYHKGEILHAAGYGLAHMEHGVPNTPDTVFRIASTSKQFVAASVLLLAQEGKIDIDEDIRTYMPDLYEYDHKVTIKAMLGMYSGMGDYDMWEDDYDWPEGKKPDVPRSIMGGQMRLGREDYLDNDEFYEIMTRMPLRGAPNQKWEYSNFAYYLLGQLVERVSGETLREYADKRIFKPLGMNQTLFADTRDEIIPKRAHGYGLRKNGGWESQFTNIHTVGDGGLHTTVEDMLKWDNNFHDPEIGTDPQAFVKQMNTPTSDHRSRDGELYANGQFVYEVDGSTRFDHGGAWEGTWSRYIRIPADSFSVAVLCNVTYDPNNGVNADKIAEGIIAAWYGKQ